MQCCSGIVTRPYINLRFESSVILYGSKTLGSVASAMQTFESSVILYGSKTASEAEQGSRLFESSVILYGSKTI